MDTIVIYCASPGNRLKYTCDWLLQERLLTDYRFTSNEEELRAAPLGIAYGKAVEGCISIPEHGLLSQTGIAALEPDMGMWNALPVLFPKEGHTVPFDIFAAVFYLISRYEEYLPYEQDKHGRYPATSSILYRKGLLQRPLIDEWVCALRKLLSTHVGKPMPATPFIFQPTYDIDIAYAHLHKGARRIIGAYARALLRMDMVQIAERTRVLKKKQKDPYDSFRWLRQAHKEYGYKPIYFVLTALRTTEFDKNIHPRHPAMMRVTKNLAKEGVVGIHPSYYADNVGAMGDEKQTLEDVSGQHIGISRQHYIRVIAPHTYRMLIACGIGEDYSMGYGAHLGFRAGTGSSFPWYDLEREEVTKLRIHPFCFMDTTAHFEQKLAPVEAFTKLAAMRTKLQQAGSTFITIFHNFSMGTAGEWKGWRQAYEHFLEETSKMM